MKLSTDIIARSVGKDILNPEGHTIGQLTEVKYGNKGNEMKYLIIGTNRLYGQGFRYFAIPVCPKLIEITEDDGIIVRATSDELKVARGLKYEKCPDPKIEFSVTIYELFGYKPKEKLPILNK